MTRVTTIEVSPVELGKLVEATQCSPNGGKAQVSARTFSNVVPNTDERALPWSGFSCVAAWKFEHERSWGG